jgi:hypothetical protein
LFITASPCGSAVTLHDYLSLIRTSRLSPHGAGFYMFSHPAMIDLSCFVFCPASLGFPRSAFQFVIRKSLPSLFVLPLSFGTAKVKTFFLFPNFIFFIF